MTHGHEIKGGYLEGKGIYIPFAPLEEGGKGNINWVNFNSIINKIYIENIYSSQPPVRDCSKHFLKINSFNKFISLFKYSGDELNVK